LLETSVYNSPQQNQKALNSNIHVIIPTFNEEKNLYDLLPKLKSCGYHNLLIVDGSSRDNTVAVSTQYGAEIILQTGRGKGQAIRQALQNAPPNVDILILMDGDGSMSPNEICNLTDAIFNGADVAKGSRFFLDGDTYDMTHLRKIGNSVMVRLTNLLHSTNYTDICYGFVALNNYAIKTLSQCLESNGFDIEAEMFIKAKKLKLKVVEVPSVEYMRKNGKSNLHSFRDGLKIIRKILGLTFY